MNTQLTGRFGPHPRFALAAAGLVLAGSMFCNRPGLLAGGWVAVHFVMGSRRALLAHWTFVGLGLLPLALMLILTWGLIVAAPPGRPVGSDPAGGIRFALVIILRLAVAAAVMQALFLSVPPDDLPATFRRWGLKGRALAIVLSSIVLFSEFRVRLRKIHESLLGSGLIRSRSSLALWRHLPRLLIPLVVWSLRTSIQRAEEWDRRMLIQQTEQLATEKYSSSFFTSFILLTLAVAWVTLAVLMRTSG